ncbi:MAG: carboxypeptidase-like regulatory domain-containing protein [Candidatus Roizmanbacteria bacterium]|nr:carboxypeptidase-like regulatory domain-containing protein [Candidatus Roizmanbacteria bacterium]
MNKFLHKFFLSIFLFLFFIAPFSLVNAQQRSERWVCLKPEVDKIYTASLSVDPEAKLLANSETYVFECIANSECTSGNADLDQQIFGRNNLQALHNQFGYRFKGSSLSSNPLMSDGEGNIPAFTWEGSALQAYTRRWLALNYFEPIPEMGTGEEKTQQIGTFSFENAVNQSDCVSIAWDPYGRVFDSKTLEPVNKTSVTLLKKRVNGAFTMMIPADLLGGSILNPQLTKEDGGFSFVVPDGTYKLTASHSNYVFPEKIVNLQSNYSKIYSDIYPDQTGEEIVQKGTIQHRDIPLKQVSAGPETNAKLMEYFYDLNKLTSTVIIKGRASHPFAKIKAYSLKPDPVSQENVRYRLLTENPLKSDKLGNFVLRVDQSQFEPTESFGEITVEKIDLTQPNLVEKIKQWLFGFISKVNAQTMIASSIRLEPILNYLEGYAYDAGGEVLPNATVSIYLNFSNKPAYQAKADDKGYYKISSEFLPSMPYRIAYTTTAGQVVKTSTSKFIAQNSDSIVASDIKINQFKNEKGETITAVPERRTTPGDFQKNGESTSPKQPKSLLSITLPLILTITIFIIAAIVILVIYIKKKKTVL